MEGKVPQAAEEQIGTPPKGVSLASKGQGEGPGSGTLVWKGPPQPSSE